MGNQAVNNCEDASESPPACVGGAYGYRLWAEYRTIRGNSMACPTDETDIRVPVGWFPPGFAKRRPAVLRFLVSSHHSLPLLMVYWSAWSTGLS